MLLLVVPAADRRAIEFARKRGLHRLDLEQNPIFYRTRTSQSEHSVSFDTHQRHDMSIDDVQMGWTWHLATQYETQVRCVCKRIICACFEYAFCTAMCENISCKSYSTTNDGTTLRMHTIQFFTLLHIRFFVHAVLSVYR